MRRFTVRSLSVLGAVAIASLALVQLGSASSDRQTAATATATTTITVKGGEFYFKLSSKSIASPRRVTFVFKNVGQVTHDFKIDGKTTPLLQPGKTARLLVTFKKKGQFPYLCTVPGHAVAGMKGVFIVR